MTNMKELFKCNKCGEQKLRVRGKECVACKNQETVHKHIGSSGDMRNDIKIKDFHCSEHGYIKPTPKCPKCGMKPEKKEEEWDEFDYFRLPKGADKVVGKKRFPDGVEMEMLAELVNIPNILKESEEAVKIAQKKEIIEMVEEYVERIRLDVDVIVCDCGEKYKDSDLDLSVGDLEKFISKLKDGTT